MQLVPKFLKALERTGFRLLILAVWWVLLQEVVQYSSILQPII